MSEDLPETPAPSTSQAASTGDAPAPVPAPAEATEPARAPTSAPAAGPSADEVAAAIGELTGIRQSIDNIDAALVHLLAERFKFTQKVGTLKATYGLPPADLEREARQITRLRGLAEDAHLDPAFAEKFLNFIIAEVIHHHERLAAGLPQAERPRA